MRQNLRNENDLSYEELYRYTYNLMLHKETQRLYTGLEQLVRAHMVVLAGQLQAEIGKVRAPLWL